MKYSPITILLTVTVALGIAIAVTGGGTLDLGVVQLSLRRAERAFAAAVVLLALRLLTARMRRPLLDGELAVAGFASVLIATFASYFVYEVRAAGGLDSYGYVSAAEAILRARLVEPLPATGETAGIAADARVPLGWTLTRDVSAAAPGFPLGFPIVLAAARAIGGREAMFHVGPVLGIATVMIAFWLARRVAITAGVWTGALAAVLVGANPVFFNMAIQPMSDVPATFWIVTAVAGVCAAGLVRDNDESTHSRVAAVVGGAAASMATLTRPPLLIPIVVLIALYWWWGGLKRVWLFAATAAAGLMVLFGLQWHMYGNPLVSGHGGTRDLFAVEALTTNLANHVKGLIKVNTPLLPATVVCAVLYGHVRFALLSVAVFIAVAVPYLFYVVRFDDWEMLRFLLPGLALLFVAAADGTIALLRRVVASRWIPASALAVAATYALWSYAFVARQATFDVRRMEAKYPLAGEMVARRTPPDAIVLAVQHSGSLRYYANRATLRWDRISADQLERLLTSGPPLYVLFDDRGEQETFRSRFADPLTRITMEPLARVRDLTFVKITTRAN